MKRGRRCYLTGCGHEECREANRLYIKDYRARKADPNVVVNHKNGAANGAATRKKTRSPPARGTRACYVTKCGHPECAEANRVYQRKYMRLWRQGGDPWIKEALK